MAFEKYSKPGQCKSRKAGVSHRLENSIEKNQPQAMPGAQISNIPAHRIAFLESEPVVRPRRIKKKVKPVGRRSPADANNHCGHGHAGPDYNKSKDGDAVGYTV